ncbi:hypothetical protein NQ317_000101 [Molorchus minor]|uniref:Uncharacterized protein n=1 Tax=Molorchus minor TaxID=1323400 RepID=A0ABQ9J0I5_9CUCU|nr:hypothetical protein NQ317_000101 [Molorchus minor]
MKRLNLIDQIKSPTDRNNAISPAIKIVSYSCHFTPQEVSRCRLIIKQFIGLFTKENIGTEEDKATLSRLTCKSG